MFQLDKVMESGPRLWRWSDPDTLLAWELTTFQIRRWVNTLIGGKPVMEYLARLIARQKYQRRSNELTPRRSYRGTYRLPGHWARTKRQKNIFVLYTSSSIRFEGAVSWDDFLNGGSAIGRVFLFWSTPDWRQSYSKNSYATTQTLSRLFMANVLNLSYLCVWETLVFFLR